MNDVQDDAERPAGRSAEDVTVPAEPPPSAAATGSAPGTGSAPATGSAPVTDGGPVTDDGPATSSGPEQAQPKASEPVQLRLRRAPKYGAFGLTGLVIGIVIGLILAYSHAAEGDYTQRTIAGYFAASFGLIGVLAGLGAAVLAERRR